LFCGLDGEHNAGVAPTGYDAPPTALVDAWANYRRQVMRASCILFDEVVRLAEGRQGKVNTARDDAIVRLRDEEGPSFGEIKDLLPTPLPRDTVERASHRRKDELAARAERQAALDAFAASLAEFETALAGPPAGRDASRLRTFANVPGNICKYSY